MDIHAYGLSDFQTVAARAAVLASDGGGSYPDACAILQALGQRGWSGSVQVRDYGGVTNGCVLAIMGSHDADDSPPEKEELASVISLITGRTVSTIQVRAAEQPCSTPGVVASFAALLRNLGYAGALPSA